MSRLLRLVLLVTLCLAGQLAVVAEHASASASGSISGFITDRTSAQPLAALCVVTRRVDTGAATASAYTQADGSYSLTGLTDGDYLVAARVCTDNGPPLAAQFYPGVDERSEASAVTVALGGPTPAVDFSLPPGGVIEGVVRNGAGEPLPNIAVSTNDERHRCGVTAADGSYRIDGLSPTLVVVEFGPCREAESNEYATQTDGQEADPPFVRYRRVHSASTISGVDATLLRWAYLRGVAHDTDGVPIRSGDVWIDGRRSGLPLVTVQTDMDGAWSRRVHPGAFNVMGAANLGVSGIVAPTFWSPSGDRAAPPGVVTVSEGLISPVLPIVQPPASSLRVRVIDTAGSPIAGAAVTFLATPQPGDDYTMATAGSGAGLVTDSSGVVTFMGMAKQSARMRSEAVGQATTYYNNVDDLASATTIRLQLGLQTSITIRMSRAPRITLVLPAAPALATAATRVAWQAADGGDGLRDIGLRYRVRSAGGYGSWVYPGQWQAVTGSGVSFTGKPGLTYCWSVRARNDWGKHSAWSPVRCSGFPRDDRAASATSGWSRRSAHGYLADTYSHAAHRGEVLSFSITTATGVFVVVDRCPGCGSLMVTFGSLHVAALSLDAPTRQHHVVIRVARSGQSVSGRVTLTTTSAKPVDVDGFGSYY